MRSFTSDLPALRSSERPGGLQDYWPAAHATEMTTNPTAEEAILNLRRRRAQAHVRAGEDRIAAPQEQGRYSARARIDMLLDEGSFEEFDTFVTHRSLSA